MNHLGGRVGDFAVRFLEQFGEQVGRARSLEPSWAERANVERSMMDRAPADTWARDSTYDMNKPGEVGRIFDHPTNGPRQRGALPNEIFGRQQFDPWRNSNSSHRHRIGEFENVEWIDDTPSMSESARAYEDAASGARSNAATGRRQVPVIDRTLPDGTKAPVKFDGIEGRTLIDRKMAIVTSPKSKAQALRQSQALRENGLTGRWEVPNEAEAARARRMLIELGITNIEVIVVPS